MDIRPILAVLVVTFLASCKASNPEQRKDKPIGSQTTQLSLWYGGTWANLVSIDVSSNGYAVITSRDCRMNKEPGVAPAQARGICVIRITDQDFKRIQAALEPFRKSAIPLASFTVGGNDLRPDGKPCRNRTMDKALVSFTWTRTDGSDFAMFDTGCDEQEFKNFYRAALDVERLIP